MNAGAAEDVASICACPICVETIQDAFVTPCGHTFCYKCISTHLKNMSNCPSCGAHLVQDHIHPNFLLSKLIKHVASSQPGSMKTALLQHVEADLAVGGAAIGLQELDAAISLLQERRQHVATHESSNKLQLLLLFLQHAKARQQGRLSELEQQLDILQQDLTRALHSQQQQQQQQQQEAAARAAANGAQASAAVAAEAAAAAEALQPGADVQQQQQQQVNSSTVQVLATPAAAAAAGAPVPASSDGSLLQLQLHQARRLGGPGSAFRRLSPAEQQQQLLQQQLQQQQQQSTVAPQGFKPFSQQQQQQQGGFRPYSKPMEGLSFSPAGGTAAATASTPAAAAAAAAAAGDVQPEVSPAAVQQQQQQQQQPLQQLGFKPWGSGFSPLGSGGFRPVSPGQQQLGFAPTSPSSAAAPASAALTQPQQPQQPPGALNAEKKRKILQQFDELQQAYTSSRLRRSSAGGPEQQPEQQQQQPLPSSVAAAGQAGAADSAAGTPAGPEAAQAAAGAAGAAAAPAAAVGAGDEGAAGLDAFSDVLSAVTHFNSLSTLAYIPPSSGSAAAAAARSAAGSSSSSACNILSSLEFDCRGQLFAAAGVQQRICVYDYSAVMAAAAAAAGPGTGTARQLAEPAAASAASQAAAAASGGSQPSFEPLLDLPTQHKISCTSFSSAVQQYLLSSDYQGLVQLWDLHSAKVVRQWQAHQRRIWVVDSCCLQPDEFATGSDDGTVKVWGLREAPAPRLLLPLRANVCSLEYCPSAAHLLAVGSAGHQVHLFDLRAPRTPLAVLSGHRKAVSCVRWAGPGALVSASTDSTLRLWCTGGADGVGSGAAGAAFSGGTGAATSASGLSGGCSSMAGVAVPRGTAAAAAAATAAGGASSLVAGTEHEGGRALSSAGGNALSGGALTGGAVERTGEELGWHCGQVFSGHSNSKHFVGLSTQGPFMACGSETNEVFVYHQGLPRPRMQCLLQALDEPRPAGSSGSRPGAAAAGGGSCDRGSAGAASGGAKSPFVSAVCWRRDSNVLLAANSRGGVWVLSLVTSGGGPGSSVQ